MGVQNGAEVRNGKLLGRIFFWGGFVAFAITILNWATSRDGLYLDEFFDGRTAAIITVLLNNEGWYTAFWCGLWGMFLGLVIMLLSDRMYITNLLSKMESAGVNVNVEPLQTQPVQPVSVQHVVSPSVEPETDDTKSNQ